MLYKKIIKPFFDFIISILVLVIVSPILLFSVLLLAVENKGSIFFFQKRPGKDAHIFKLMKLKTMNNKVDKSGNLLPDALRLTKTGKIIRKLSLDELPQFFNVLKCDMSIIGPRPLLIEYLPLYSEEQKRRHSVKPGITGWAQVNGRNTISWQNKFKYDLYYVDHISFMLDLKILFLTINKIIKQDGISPTDGLTMEEFKG
jgi:undecaprenyl phosphate N,N'-diacetylbacillosamine 1-phosphate transferase